MRLHHSGRFGFIHVKYSLRHQQNQCAPRGKRTIRTIFPLLEFFVFQSERLLFENWNIPKFNLVLFVVVLCCCYCVYGASVLVSHCNYVYIILPILRLSSKKYLNNPFSVWRLSHRICIILRMLSRD